MTHKLKTQLYSTSFPNKHFTPAEMKKIRSVNLVRFIKWLDKSLLVWEDNVCRLDGTQVQLKGNIAIDYSEAEPKEYNPIDVCIEYLGLPKYKSLWILYEFYKFDLKKARFDTANVVLSKDEFTSRIGTKYYLDIGNDNVIANLIQTQGLSEDVVNNLYLNGLVYTEEISLHEFRIMLPLFNNGEIVAFECYSTLSYLKNQKHIIAMEGAEDYGFIYNGQAVDKSTSVMDFLRSIS